MNIELEKSLVRLQNSNLKDEMGLPRLPLLFLFISYQLPFFLTAIQDHGPFVYVKNP